jgi:hypothetical protein
MLRLRWSRRLLDVGAGAGADAALLRLIGDADDDDGDVGGVKRPIKGKRVLLKCNIRRAIRAHLRSSLRTARDSCCS